MVARRTVWDLLPQRARRSAWAPPLRPAGPAHRPRSCRCASWTRRPRRGGERRFTTVSHWNKLLKGALVRHVLATGADEPDALAAFEHPEGYRYDPSLTEEAERRGSIVSMVRPAR